MSCRCQRKPTVPRRDPDFDPLRQTDRFLSAFAVAPRKACPPATHARSSLSARGPPCCSTTTKPGWQTGGPDTSEWGADSPLPSRCAMRDRAAMWGAPHHVRARPGSGESVADTLVLPTALPASLVCSNNVYSTRTFHYSLHALA